jgi:ATP-dependent DNA ligase
MSRLSLVGCLCTPIVFPHATGLAADAALIDAKSFTIDGETVVLGPDGLSRFEELSGVIPS